MEGRSDKAYIRRSAGHCSVGCDQWVLWEMSTAVNLVKPERLLLLVPLEISYKQFGKKYAKLFQAGLPEDLGSGWVPGDQQNSQNLCCYIF